MLGASHVAVSAADAVAVAVAVAGKIVHTPKIKQNQFLSFIYKIAEK
jgi:hypothetical protein